MNYLVIDLEMCGVPQTYRSEKYKYSNEIIQIGAVLLNQKFGQAETFAQFVHPEYGVLDHFISDLTAQFRKIRAIRMMSQYVDKKINLNTCYIPAL